MEENKINVEVKKVNKKTKEIEWTETLEIPYEVSQKISEEEKRRIEEKYSNNKNEINNDRELNPLLNTSVLQMEANPFHQPSMNTIEFDKEDTIIIANISKENDDEINENDELKALEKLLENKIINEKEFEEKKKIILKK